MLEPDVVEPESIGAAIQALATQRGAVALAGATDLIPAMRRGEIKPRVLVNLKRIPALAGVRRAGNHIRIGALTRIADIAKHRSIVRDLPILVEVAGGFGSPQIRNAATLGGNLCNAAPSADFAPPLLAVDARVEIQGPEGRREVELAEFFRGVNRTRLRRGEILTAILVPRPPVRSGVGYAKLGVRRAMDLAFVSAAAALTLAADNRTCRKARVALGAVAPTPMRAREAEPLLEGKAVTRSVIAEAAAAAATESRPVSDLRASAEYRGEMVGVLTDRVLREALRRARQKEQAE